MSDGYGGYSKSELMQRSVSQRILTTVAVGAGAVTGTTDVIGTGAAGVAIPSGKRLCIWRITMTAQAVGAETLQVASGAAVAPAETNVLGRWNFGTTDNDTLVVGGDITAPIIVEQNAMPATGTSTHQYVGFRHAAAPVEAVVDYYLLP
jgi:hypothetical protein